MKVPEGYVGFVEELPGANRQAKTLDEARHSLNEAVKLVPSCINWRIAPLAGARGSVRTSEPRLQRSGCANFCNLVLVLDGNRTLTEESIEGAGVIRETFVLSAA
jgi:hypothetical protein